MVARPARATGLRFPFLRPSLPEPEEWLPFLEPSYEGRWFTNRGPALLAFEAAVERRFGRSCAGVVNGTLGLTAALLALDVRGRVILPAFTFPATAHAVALAGCEPVFCDVSRETWELDPVALGETLTASGASAVIHVRSFGLCRDLLEIERICAAEDVPLIVDAAAALGGSSPTGPVGQAGTCEVFSLHATKTFAVGEGGVVLGDPGVIERVRHVSNFALAGGEVTGRGLNAKLDDFAAARGRAMLERLDADIAAHAALASAYRATLRSPLVTHPASPGDPPWQTYPIELADGESRDALLDLLGRRGVEARPYYTPALHETTAFRAPLQLPVTERLSRSVLCLPVYSDATPEEAAELTRLVAEALEEIAT